MSTAMLAAIQAGELLPAFFVEAHFRDGIAYLWSGYGSITWGGHAWLGTGSLGSISAMEEGSNVEARGITIALSGIDTGLLAEAMGEIQQGLPALVYLGLFNGSSLIDTPIKSWAGSIDEPLIDVDGSTATISINCENRLIEMNVAKDRRYTQDDQQIDNPGDLGFMFVLAIQEMAWYWGSAPTSSANI